MTCATARYRQVMIGVLLLAMLGMPWALSLQRMQNTTREQKQPPSMGKFHTHAQRRTDGQTGGQQEHFAGEKLGDNALVYAPPSGQVVGSLILLMGCGGDHWWTLTQWWYLHPAWSPSDQEWCGHSCVFAEEDKVAARYLTNNLRIVDAVGDVKLAKDFYGWYNYASWPDGAPVEDELEGAVARVFAIIEHEYKIVGDYKRIAIAGMSQGADLALLVGIRFPQQLGMVVSERGIVMPPTHAKGNQSLAALPGTPFVLTGGDADEVTPLATYKGSCASLQLMQAPVYFKSFAGLDHGSFSKPEWTLLIQIFSTMLSPNPKTTQLDYLSFWDPCVA